MSFKVAGVQMDIQFSAPEKNLESMFVRLRQTVSEGAALTVFPECTTTGYCFSSFDEAWEQAEPLGGASVSAVHQQCIELQTRVVFGMLERDVDAAGAKRIFNVVVLVGPSGIEGVYRKVHLPHLGVDRFTTSGEGGFSVVENELGRMGMNICYDSSFPEAARCLTLAGADLIILPTNWPPTSGRTADVIPPARALENHVYFMAINRIGEENGFEFIGKSKICSPSGEILDQALANGESILYAEIKPEYARQKHLVNISGAHEVHRIEDRHPDAYGPICDS